MLVFGGLQSDAIDRADNGAQITADAAFLAVGIAGKDDPTAVSPDNINASAPSSTALATSDTSARVGTGLEIIDSNI